jgi:hypothetical protein
MMGLELVVIRDARHHGDRQRERQEQRWLLTWIVMAIWVALLI